MKTFSFRMNKQRIISFIAHQNMFCISEKAIKTRARFWLRFSNVIFYLNFSAGEDKVKGQLY